MSIHAAPRHQTRTVPVDPRGPGRRAPEVTPNPVAAVVFCLLVLAGGAFAGHQWLVETCPTSPSADLQQVCTAVLGA